MQFYNRNLFRNPNAETSGNGPAAKAPAIDLNTVTLEMVLALKPEQQDALMKQFDARVTGIKDSQKEVKTESKRAAILLAGAEVRVNKGIDAGVFPSTYTVSKLYEQVTGHKPPGHVFTLKCAYVSYVKSGKVSEADYLGNRNNCLELAQKIVDAVIEQQHPEGLQHEAVSRAATELKTRNDNEAKVLRGILASVKPAKLMTAEEALEAFTEICASGNLPVCLAQMTDEVKKMDVSGQKAAYLASAKAIENLDKALGENVDAWLAEANANAAGVQITRGETSESSAPSDAKAPEPQAALAE